MGASEYHQSQRSYQGQRQSTANTNKKAPDSNLNIDYVPNKSEKKEDNNYRGGDYVDFEEVD